MIFPCASRANTANWMPKATSEFREPNDDEEPCSRSHCRARRGAVAPPAVIPGGREYRPERGSTLPNHWRVRRADCPQPDQGDEARTRGGEEPPCRRSRG